LKDGYRVSRQFGLLSAAQRDLEQSRGEYHASSASRSL
jgi:hypothetical protein